VISGDNLWNVKKNKIKRIVHVHTKGAKEREFVVNASNIIYPEKSFQHAASQKKLKKHMTDHLRDLWRITDQQNLDYKNLRIFLISRTTG